MKQYERVADLSLMPKTPVIVRVDGKAFHSYTRGMNKPWDVAIEESMASAMLSLCRNIDGARLGYMQSDEISVLVADWSMLATQPWLSYRIQKLASIAASMATVDFNDSMQKLLGMTRKALFDARVFNLPHHEVANYFIWRQQDAVRNSIQGLGQAYFSHRELHGVSCGQIQEKLFAERGLNWNDIPTHRKRGACAVRAPRGDGDGTLWTLDLEPPTFTKDREYVARLVREGEL